MEGQTGVPLRADEARVEADAAEFGQQRPVVERDGSGGCRRCAEPLEDGGVVGDVPDQCAADGRRCLVQPRASARARDPWPRA
ncbi:MAG: hypothetical protein HND58_08505 [Planctomycetota bacterium]|nr:MAG: hypothetical protein HND58_08505 [Planctomycetota bacterium]